MHEPRHARTTTRSHALYTNIRVHTNAPLSVCFCSVTVANKHTQSHTKHSRQQGALAVSVMFRLSSFTIFNHLSSSFIIFHPSSFIMVTVADVLFLSCC
mmetsp:Transcript_1826/g.2506  ORF Transcript_1826/g.2506 Transcript_1826/m.2506 type:complete len:99 (-) Transcript_1826:124-420(-)